MTVIKNDLFMQIFKQKKSKIFDGLRFQNVSVYLSNIYLPANT